MNSLPLLSSETHAALNLVPGSVAREYGVFPVSGRLPERDRFREQYGFVRLLCLTELTKKQRANLQFLVPYFSFELIDPDHPEYAQYGEIIRHFRELIAHHFHCEGEKELIGVD